MTEKPKPCPFCGSEASVEPWHGGGPRKTLVGCVNDECAVYPNACGPTRAKAIAAWNRRSNG